MYEAVRAAPAGEATVRRLALTAREYGYDGIVVRNPGDQQPSYDAGAVADEVGVDVVDGVEVRADDPETASGHLGNVRPEHTVVAVRGGSPAVNRFAAEQPAVDVLASPMAGEGDVNHVIARAAADNGVRVEFDLRPVLRETGGTRVRAVQGLRKLAELVDDADAPFVVTADPRSHLQFRAWRELVAVAEVVGLDEATVREGLREWGRLAQRNRERQSDAFVEPGVRVVEGDDAAGDEADDAGGDEVGDATEDEAADAGGEDAGDSADADDVATDATTDTVDDAGGGRP